MDLPEGVLLNIFDYFDFEFLQKTCVLVSKKWFKIIRNDSKLSSKFKLSENFEKSNYCRLNIIVQVMKSLSKGWPKLETIHVPNQFDEILPIIGNLPSLQNIILDVYLPIVIHGESKIKVSRYCFDLNKSFKSNLNALCFNKKKRIEIPVKSLINVMGLQIIDFIGTEEHTGHVTSSIYRIREVK